MSCFILACTCFKICLVLLPTNLSSLHDIIYIFKLVHVHVYTHSWHVHVHVHVHAHVPGPIQWINVLIHIGTVCRKL